MSENKNKSGKQKDVMNLRRKTEDEKKQIRGFYWRFIARKINKKFKI